jgi:hypothetical protein
MAIKNFMKKNVKANLEEPSKIVICRYMSKKGTTSRQYRDCIFLAFSGNQMFILISHLKYQI